MTLSKSSDQTSVARSRCLLNTVFHLWFRRENTESLTDSREVARNNTRTKQYIDAAISIHEP